MIAEQMVSFDYDYVDFKVKKEDWNAYKLEDGVSLKFKVVLIKVIKPKEERQGVPLAFATTNVLAVFSPKELRGTPSGPTEGDYEIEKYDVSFETLREDWNEYELEDGRILKIKPAISIINKTKHFDRAGEPIYLVESNLLTKVLPPTT